MNTGRLEMHRQISQKIIHALMIAAALTSIASCATTSSSDTVTGHDAIHDQANDRVAIPLGELAFLTGAWKSEDATDDSWTEERWTPEAGHTMFATNRVIRDGRCVFFEFLRIEQDPSSGDIIYHAAPKGRYPATPFTMIACDPNHRVTFENPEHDFPKRIIYELHPQSGVLIMRIEGEQNGQPAASEWRMFRLED